jgi:predicted ester cyclase
MVNQANKELVWAYWQSLNHAHPGDLRDLAGLALDPQIAWFGPQPINSLVGRDAVVEGFLEPLLAAFPDCRRECDVFLGGETGGEHWVSACGYLEGTFAHDWLGIPATGGRTYIHFGEHLRVEEGRVVETYLILDVLAVIRQAGFQLLPPARGAEGGRMLRPTTGDGVLLTEQEPRESRVTRQLVWAMLEALYRGHGEYERMEMGHYWDPYMHWYGPTGIGSCYSLREFEEFHQRPWMIAFPDHGRHDSARRMIGLQNGEVLAEGRYAALGVWDCPFSVHRGPFLGVPATERRVSMRDFDWYRRDGQRLVQNWVPIDIIDILLELGDDVMARLAVERDQRDARQRSVA